MTTDNSKLITSLELQLDILKKRNESLQYALDQEIKENMRFRAVCEAMQKVADAARHTDFNPLNKYCIALREALQALDEVKR